MMNNNDVEFLGKCPEYIPNQTQSRTIQKPEKQTNLLKEIETKSTLEKKPDSFTYKEDKTIAKVIFELGLQSEVDKNCTWQRISELEVKINVSKQFS